MTNARGNGEGSVYKEMRHRKDGPVERWIAQVMVDGKKSVAEKIGESEQYVRDHLRMHRFFEDPWSNPTPRCLKKYMRSLVEGEA